MWKYALTRIGSAVVVLICVTVVTTAVVHIIPGDPVITILGPRASPQLVAQVRAEMGFDQSVWEQILSFWQGLLQGDLGRDFMSHRPVTDIILEAAPHTIALALSTIAVSVLCGIPLGVFAARRPGSWADRIVGAASVSLMTIPTYVTALLLVLLFCVRLNWLPAVGAGRDPLDYLGHLILPTAVLAFEWIGYLARLVRSSMVETLASDYIRTSKALGVPSRVWVYKHALRNALIPSISVLGVGLGLLLGGAVFAESILARPGLGTLLVSSLTTRNYPVLRGTVLVVACAFVLSNMVADLLNRAIDPRTRRPRAS